LATVGWLAVLGDVQAGRHEEYTARFAKGEKATPVAATFFGGSGAEEFVDVGQLPDGTIVAFGNSSGPDFPATPKPVVLGAGQHRGLKSVVVPAKGSKQLAQENPDLAGMLVFYDDKLSRVLKTVRFDWGVASLSMGVVGGDGNGLCSDSSVRGVVFGPTGDMIVLGWSDGGNSVFTRQPTDWREAAGKSALGMQSWGMKSASSLAYVMVIDPKTHQQKAWTLFLPYIPMTFEAAKFRGAPNSSTIDEFCGLADGSIGFAGKAGTGLIQTPNALYAPPTDGRKYSGSFVAIMTRGMDDLLFSSHLPGCNDISLAHTKRGLIAASRSEGQNRDDPPAPSPTIKPIQGTCNGEFDGHLLLLESPPSR
jgi:hypothetical protein